MNSLMKFDYFNKILMLYLCHCAYINVVKLCEAYQTKNRRMWTRPIYTENERELHGFFNKIFLVVKEKDEEQFRKATRMGIKQFEILNNILQPYLQKENVVRNSIDPECRLVITLVYLAHGAAWQVLAWSFRIGVSTIREIILEVCEVIWDQLRDIYLSPPTELEWKKIAEDFYTNTKMPNVVGAIDGKHIAIKCPPHAGSLYYNYKKYNSIVLLAVCDSNYVFSAVDIGAYGSQIDGGILQKSAFGEQILKGNINIPKSMILPNTSEEFPCFFIGDAAFPLRKNLMRPYPGRLLSKDKETFNKKLSSARVKIENTFGILTAKFRVLTNSLNVFPENAEKIVRAAVVLHNFIRLQDPSNYISQNYVDYFNNEGDLIEGSWRQEVNPLPQFRFATRYNSTRDAFAMRDYLKDYINSVPNIENL